MTDDPRTDVHAPISPEPNKTPSVAVPVLLQLAEKWEEYGKRIVGMPQTTKLYLERATELRDVCANLQAPPGPRFCSHCGEELDDKCKGPFDAECDRMALHIFHQACGCAECRAAYVACPNTTKSGYRAEFSGLVHFRKCSCPLCLAFENYQAAIKFAARVRST
jgi:hypothetical protein